MAAGDGLGGSARTVTAIGVVRLLHGVAVGLALPATVGLAWDRGPRPRRWLAAPWWAGTGGRPAALAPYPWLTGAALTVAALSAVLAVGPGLRHGLARARARGARADAT